MLIWATVVFFSFFGPACTFANAADTPDDMRKFGRPLCPKLESEIFNTGLAIIAFILLLIVTSYFRKTRRVPLLGWWVPALPYEVFYWSHHAFLLIFALGIAHTLDVVT